MAAGDDEEIVVGYVDDSQSVDAVATQLERECEALAVTATATPGDILDELDTVDCLVSGYRLPDMDGLELLRAVRRTHPELPVVLFVADGSEEVACEAIAHGVTGYVRRNDENEVATLAARIEQVVADAHSTDAVSGDATPRNGPAFETVSSDVADWTAQERTFSELGRFSRELVENAPVGLVRLDEELRVTYENPQAKQMFGVPDREESAALGRDARTLPSVVSTGLVEKLDRLTEGETVTFDRWFESIYGTESYLSGQGVPLFRDGEFDGALLLLIDQTERREYEQELTRTRDLLANVERLAAVGGWELDVESGQMYWTEGTRRIHEVDDEFDPTVEKTFGFIHPDDRDEIRGQFDDAVETGESCTARYRIFTANGNERWIRTRSELLETDGIVRTVRGFIHDVTDQIENEQQLSVLDRVLRHNLRNDMNVIMANAELLAKHVEGENGELAEKILETSEELLESTDKQREIVHLLSLSHQQSADTHTLTELLDQSSVQIQQRYSAVDVSLSPPESDTAAVHPVLGRAITELVENAVRHSDRETPTVEIRGEVGPKTVEIHVADDGPGIPEQERKVIVGQSEEPLRHASGMGLWLVKWLVSRTGGRLTFDENEPRGSIVRITLPRNVTDDESQDTS